MWTVLLKADREPPGHARLSPRPAEPAHGDRRVLDLVAQGSRRLSALPALSRAFRFSSRKL